MFNSVLVKYFQGKIRSFLAAFLFILLEGCNCVYVSIQEMYHNLNEKRKKFP